MLGIKCKWECPSCGNCISTDSPFWSKKYMKLVSEPKSCGCGRKNDFNLLGFEECHYTIEDENDRQVAPEATASTTVSE